MATARPVKPRPSRHPAILAVLAVAAGVRCATARTPDPADPAGRGVEHGADASANTHAPSLDGAPVYPGTDPSAFIDGASSASCDPDESEVCVCADGTTGSRRCDSRGRAFGACDACPRGTMCGARTCEMLRVEPVALSLPACCPPGRADRCGIDVSFVARSYGYRTACLELSAPGEPDARCPSTSVLIPEQGSVTFAGCRTPRGRCGFDVDIPNVIDLGCTEAPESER